MAYGSGIRDHRVTILKKVVATGFGETTGYVAVKTVWASFRNGTGEQNRSVRAHLTLMTR